MSTFHTLLVDAAELTDVDIRAIRNGNGVVAHPYAQWAIQGEPRYLRLLAAALAEAAGKAEALAARAVPA